MEGGSWEELRERNGKEKWSSEEIRNYGAKR
jgi:hypothetical protein